MNELTRDRGTAISARRQAFSQQVVRLSEPFLTAVAAHWLLAANLAVLLFVGGAFAAPLMLASGWQAPATALYEFYGAICHQWTFRSFFLLGPQVVYAQSELIALGLDPYGTVGGAALGWKLAFCERDLAIFSGLLLFGGLYAARWRRGNLPPATFSVYMMLIAPMAIDGLSQLFLGRESTWELRVATGLLFGLASGWLLYPRFDWAARRSANQ